MEGEVQLGLQKDKTPRYAAVDLMKVVCSFFVIMIHFPPCALDSHWNDFLIGYIANIAVPFFFVCAGYFCFLKANRGGGTNRYTLKMLKLYTVWVIVYVTFSLVTGNGISFRVFIDYLIGYGHLWFLKALAVAIFLCGFLRAKKVSVEKICVIALIFYLFGAIWENVYPLIFDKPCPAYYARSGLFNGFLFVATGAFFAQRERTVGGKKEFIGLGCFALLWGAECLLNRAFSITTGIFLVPLIVTLFCLLLKTELHLNTKAISNMSAIVYYVHILVGIILLGGVRRLFHVEIFKPLQFLIIGVVSYAVAFVLIKIKECKGFKWIKHFFN